MLIKILLKKVVDANKNIIEIETSQEEDQEED